MIKQKKITMASFIILILGVACWVPNLLFYTPNNPPILIVFTPFIGGTGILLAKKVENPKIKYTLIFLNLLVAISLALVFFFGTLIFGS